MSVIKDDPATFFRDYIGSPTFEPFQASIIDEVWKPRQTKYADAMFTMTNNVSERSVASKKLMQPMSTAPKGREVMLFCPKEKPQHVAAIFESVKLPTGELAWEGWVYADELLRDVCPDGPQGATHWYEPPSENLTVVPAEDAALQDAMKAISANIQKKQEEKILDAMWGESRRSTGISPDAFRREYEAEFSLDGDYEDNRFTPAQLAELRQRGIKPRGVQIQKLWYQAAIDTVDVRSWDDPYAAPIRVRSSAEEVLCPILLQYPQHGECEVVLPDGTIKRTARTSWKD